jgi:poly(ADP-ribose) glycohydrolase ARH3
MSSKTVGRCCLLDPETCLNYPESSPLPGGFMAVDIRDKFLGGMIGSALGDAIGELAFSHPERDRLIAAVERSPELSYTDDTAMAIGLAEALVREEKINQQIIGKIFSEHYRQEPWRGYASGPPTIFHMVQQLNIPYKDAARQLFGGGGSLGNGAAMRIVGVGLFFHTYPDLYEEAAASAEVTHAHPVGMDGAAIQARAVANAVKLDPQSPFSWEPFIQDLKDRSRSPVIREKMALVNELLGERVSPSRAARILGQRVAVHESMPFAVYSFLSFPKSFEACLYCAALNGGDRDTLGAMACAISGAYLGIDAIPETWKQRLENRSLIEGLALSLYEKCK